MKQEGAPHRRADLRHVSRAIRQVREAIDHQYDRACVDVAVENMYGKNDPPSKNGRTSDLSAVFMDFAVNGRPLGRVGFKLYDDQTPLTAENFRQLCTHKQVGF